MLSWWQRKAASAFVAEPPTSSIEEALENFLKVQSKKIQHDNISVFVATAHARVATMLSF